MGREMVSKMTNTSYLWVLAQVACFISCVLSQPSAKYYGDECRTNLDCVTNWCSTSNHQVLYNEFGKIISGPKPLTGKCSCIDKRLHNGRRLIQFYDEVKQYCFSGVGQICTLGSSDHKSSKKVHPGLVPELYCVPNAECVSFRHGKLSKKFGHCQCRDGFEKTYKHLCDKPAPKIHITEALSTKEQTEGSQENMPKIESLRDPSLEPNNNFKISVGTIKKYTGVVPTSGSNYFPMKFNVVLISVCTMLATLL